MAFNECDEELRAEALNLLKLLHSGELDAEQRIATTALLAEILFPHADAQGIPGIDLDEAEKLTPRINPEARGVIERMDREEADFASRVRDLMDKNGINQADLAAKVGIGQPAVSMMLSRSCRPQRKTVVRFAEALGVPPSELWPGIEEE